MIPGIISIALCTFNSTRFLPQLLNSLLDQTWSNIEIVCCDDKSTDNTREILKQYCHKYPSIFRLYFNECNLGYIKNFEKALSLCRGEFIAIADHDDVWMPEKIEKLASAIGYAMMIYGNSVYIDAEGKDLQRQLKTRKQFYNNPNERSFAFESPVWGHTTLIRKELLNYALPIPAETPHDIWLAYIASSISEVKYFDEPLTYYRLHAASYSYLLDKKRKKDANRKYTAWKEEMYWLQLLKKNPYSKYNPFFNTLHGLYSLKAHKIFVPSLFLFLHKHRNVLFKLSKRSYISNLNEVRKMARGVNANFSNE